MATVKPTLYLETTIPSYLAARPSTDSIVLAHQEITRDWWENRLSRYDVHVSVVVYDEIARGDADAAGKRLNAIAGFPKLSLSREAEALAQAYIRELLLPKTASADALHLAIASVSGMEYLLTWNCHHIARGSVIRKLPVINATHGYGAPTICTPEELMHEDPEMD